MTDGTPSVFVFLNRKVLKTDKMRIKGPLPPQIQERETEKKLISSSCYSLASLSRFSLTTERTHSRTSSASLRSMK